MLCVMFQLNHFDGNNIQKHRSSSHYRQISKNKRHLLADLKSIPVRVPAATVLTSSSAPLAFSITTPKALYNKAAMTEQYG